MGCRRNGRLWDARETVGPDPATAHPTRRERKFLITAFGRTHACHQLWAIVRSASSHSAAALRAVEADDERVGFITVLEVGTPEDCGGCFTLGEAKLFTVVSPPKPKAVLAAPNGKPFS